MIYYFSLSLTNWNVIKSRRWNYLLLLMMMDILLLTEHLSCSRVNDRYCSNSSRRYHLMLVIAAVIAITKVIILVVFCSIIATATITTMTTTATKTTVNTARTCTNWTSGIFICNPLSHWRGSVCLLWILLMHRYSNRGHVARINNRDCSCSICCWCWIWFRNSLLIVMLLLSLLLLLFYIIRWWYRWRWWWYRCIWRWIWRCTFLNSFPMFGNLMFIALIQSLLVLYEKSIPLLHEK